MKQAGRAIRDAQASGGDLRVFFGGQFGAKTPYSVVRTWTDRLREKRDWKYRCLLVQWMSIQVGEAVQGPGGQARQRRTGCLSMELRYLCYWRRLTPCGLGMARPGVKIPNGTKKRERTGVAKGVKLVGGGAVFSSRNPPIVPRGSTPEKAGSRPMPMTNAGGKPRRQRDRNKDGCDSFAPSLHDSVAVNGGLSRTTRDQGHKPEFK